jgi:hypothetical protein
MPRRSHAGGTADRYDARVLRWLSILVLALAAPRPAEACSSLANPDLVLDRQMYGSDHVAPQAPIIDDALMYRMDAVGDCAATGYLMFSVRGFDNATPAYDLGFQLDAIDDDPAGIDDDRTRDAVGDKLYFTFPYDTPDFEEDIEIRAVDLNGNVGPNALWHLSYVQQAAEPTRGGCSTTRSPSWLVLAFIALVYARRHARASA